MTPATDRCAICSSSAWGGTLAFTAEVRGAAGGWNPVSITDEFGLCAEDYDRLVEYADAITASEQGTAVLGLPLRPTPFALGPDHCDCCQAELPDQASTMELVPAAQAYRRGSRTHRVGTLRWLRVCRLCLGWWQSAVRNPGGILGYSRSTAEGSSGGWLNPGHAGAAVHALRHRDTAMVAATMEADGASFRSIGRGAALTPSEVAFVAAGKRDRATAFVRAANPAERHRIAVVALSDQLEDAMAALKLGAGELLASPLSPQQIVGAAVRLAGQRRMKDPATGLPILGAAAPEFGRSCISYTVEARDPAQWLDPMLLMEFALVARRFLRGYDEVGSDGNGSLQLNVFADVMYRTRIAEVLGAALGRGAVLKAGPVRKSSSAVA